MKSKELKYVKLSLLIYIFIGLIISCVGTLYLNVQLSTLNLEYDKNLTNLEDLKANNSYLEMKKNENLTREKIEVFASSNGLVPSFPNVVDLEDEE
ncbi:MAG: hypothetical protein ACK5NF_01900 [Bacilli bacterium]